MSSMVTFTELTKRSGENGVSSLAGTLLREGGHVWRLRGNSNLPVETFGYVTKTVGDYNVQPEIVIRMTDSDSITLTGIVPKSIGKKFAMNSDFFVFSEGEDETSVLVAELTWVEELDKAHTQLLALHALIR